MRVLVLANTRSGRGKAAATADRLARAMEHEGHVVRRLQPGHATEPPSTLDALFDEAEAVISVSGDGTIFHALPQLLRTNTPVYHAPGGNENLFAREFGMTAEPSHVLRVLANHTALPVDVGVVNSTPFAMMVSIGPDAGVIQRLHANRTRATGHAMYIAPTLAEFRHPTLPSLTITIDGRRIVSAHSGFAIVANCRRYAFGLDPARSASMRDGILDVVFFPANSLAHALLWIVRCMVDDPREMAGVVAVQGGEITLQAETRAPWQADGEPGGWLDPGESLRLGVNPGALRVLSPPV